ncbi:MAG: hypothetical protein ACKO65_01275, partial [Betaproteobacteria bacterium]
MRVHTETRLNRAGRRWFTSAQSNWISAEQAAVDRPLRVDENRHLRQGSQAWIVTMDVCGVAQGSSSNAIS